MDFAFIVLSFNHPVYTARALDSGIALGIPPEGIVLVHNGSEAKHVAALQKQYAHVQHVVLQHNRGYAGGVNAGLEAGCRIATWCLLLTNDSLLVSLPELPHIPALVGPSIFRRSLQRIDSMGAVFIPHKAKLRHCRSRSEFESALSSKHTLPYIPGTAFLVHREVVHKVMGLEENLHMYWDDVEWCQRVAQAGFPLQVSGEWRVLHKVGRTCQSNPLYTLYYFQRNRKRVSWRYTPLVRKPMLALRLFGGWSKLLLKLIARGRFADLGYFFRFVFA